MSHPLRPPCAKVVMFVVLVGAIIERAAAESPLVKPVASWSFETIDHAQGLVTPASGDLPGIVHGSPQTAPGVAGNSCMFDGGESLIEVRGSEQLTNGSAGFTVTAWVNVYGLDHRQQMIVAKNRYSLGERQWGVMIDKDDCFRLYIHQGNWKTTDSTIKPTPGRWYHIAVVSDGTQASLFVNGKESGTVRLARPIPQTKARLTVGGVNDNGRIWQTCWGAIDEVKVYDQPLTPEVIKTQYRPIDATHELPRIRANRFELWDATAPIPAASNLLPLKGVEFHVIKPRVPDQDGYNWLHGVALAWHGDKLYSSFGHNTGAENTATEEANGCVSTDGGRTWGPLFQIDAGDEPDLAISHGVFHSHEDSLWAFHGAFHGRMQNVHTRAYLLDERSGYWQPKGVVAEDGFWAMQEPQRMGDGNWIMSGLAVTDGYGGTDDPAAVAISHGDDLTKWDVVKIPKPAAMAMWGESCVIVDGPKLLSIARFRSPIALAATSQDFGRTWTSMRESNMPMAASQPSAGTLSNGQRFLVCTTSADSGNRRWPLTIAVSDPGENRFSRIYRIRDAIHDGPGESAANAALAYPYAVEHQGHLYVGYSNSGGRGGNRNSAELAIIPISSLQAK